MELVVGAAEEELVAFRQEVDYSSIAVAAEAAEVTGIFLLVDRLEALDAPYEEDILKRHC